MNTNPNNIIAALLDIASAAWALNHSLDESYSETAQNDIRTLDRALNKLDPLPQPEGQAPLTGSAKARYYMQSFLEGVIDIGGGDFALLFNQSGGAANNVAQKWPMIENAPSPQPKRPNDGWVLAKETVVEMPDGKKELGYTTISGLPVFTDNADAHKWHAKLALPLGWVVMSVNQLIPGYVMPEVEPVERPKISNDEALVMEAFDFGQFSSDMLGIHGAARGLVEPVRAALTRVLEKRYAELYGSITAAQLTTGPCEQANNVQPCIRTIDMTKPQNFGAAPVEPDTFVAAMKAVAVQDAPVEDLQRGVLYHLGKGHTVAVAAYCMALWTRNASVRDWAPDTGHLPTGYKGMMAREEVGKVEYTPLYMQIAQADEETRKRLAAAGIDPDNVSLMHPLPADQRGTIWIQGSLEARPDDYLPGIETKP